VTTPIGNLALFAGIISLAVVLFWPSFGFLPRLLRERLVATRVRIEDALKHVYHQQTAGQTATIPSVGGALQVSPGRVVELVERMQQAGLVRFTDGRVLLTEHGERYALQVIRAHRLWERYLADETGVDPREWHARAERREHRMTALEADALAERLGDPRFDPHGDPIPTAEGDLPGQESRVIRLSELGVDERADVVHIEDEPEVVFAQLMAQGIYLGAELHVRSSDDRRMVLETDGRTVTLAPVVAANVSVLPHRSEEGVPPGQPSLTLADLRLGGSAEVVRISPAVRGVERRRLMDLGFVPGTKITLERRSMTGDPAVYRVRGTMIALRRTQAQAIAVSSGEDSPTNDLGTAAS
jgi:DtxR family Mn-dependent transcriptional regulator